MKAIHLLFYDISSNGTRSKANKIIVDSGGEMLQYSVYTYLASQSSFVVLRNKLSSLLLEEGDSIMYVKLTKEMFRKLGVIGSKEVDISYLIGERKSLII